MPVTIILGWIFAALMSMSAPMVFVCESDGEIVAPRDVRDGQRVEDGCYVHRMKVSQACSIARCD